jgi:hypothetical protein
MWPLMGISPQSIRTPVGRVSEYRLILPMECRIDWRSWFLVLGPRLKATECISRVWSHRNSCMGCELLLAMNWGDLRGAIWLRRVEGGCEDVRGNTIEGPKAPAPGEAGAPETTKHRCEFRGRNGAPWKGAGSRKGGDATHIISRMRVTGRQCLRMLLCSAWRESVTREIRVASPSFPASPSFQTRTREIKFMSYTLPCD